MREEPGALLNAPSVLGEYLAKIGIDQVKIVPSVFMDNEEPIVVLHISYKMFSRFQKELEHLMIKPNEEAT